MYESFLDNQEFLRTFLLNHMKATDEVKTLALRAKPNIFFDFRLM